MNTRAFGLIIACLMISVIHAQDTENSEPRVVVPKAIVNLFAPRLENDIGESIAVFESRENELRRVDLGVRCFVLYQWKGKLGADSDITLDKEGTCLPPIWASALPL
jgi:hypothetical protein